MQRTSNIQTPGNRTIAEAYSVLNGRYANESIMGFKLDRVVMKSYDTVNDRNVIVIQAQIPKNAFAHQYLKAAIRELLCMKNIRHPNIIKMHTAFTNYNSAEEMLDFYIIREHVDGSLSMIDKHLLTHAHLKYIMEQVAMAALFLHRIGIVHRNISPTSILIDSVTTQIKLCDFRQANATEPFIDTPYVVKRHYRAPEIICNLENRINTKVDVWSIGCVLLAMLTDQVPFEGKDNFDQYRQIVLTLGPPDDSFLEQIPPTIRPFVERYRNCPAPPPDQILAPDTFLPNYRADLESAEQVSELLRAMLVIDANRRAELEDVLQLPYIGVNREELQASTASLHNEVRDLFAWQNYHDAESIRQEIFNILQQFKVEEQSSDE